VKFKSVKSFAENLPDDKKILVILDNASWHKKAVRLIRENKDFIGVEFLFLPAYLPELNPIERVWRITRRERTHNRFFEKLKILQTVLTKYFESFRVPDERLKTLCA